MGSRGVTRPSLLCSAGMPLFAAHSSKTMAEDNKMCQTFRSVSLPRDGDWASLLWREAPPHSTSPAAMSALLPGSGWRQPVMCDSHHQCVTHATASSSDERCFLHDCTMETGTQLSLVIRHKCSTDVVGQVQNSSGPWNFCWLSFSWCSHNSQPSSDSRRSFQILTYQHQIFMLKMCVLPAASPLVLYTCSDKSIQGFWSCTFTCIPVPEVLKNKQNPSHHPPPKAAFKTHHCCELVWGMSPWRE